MIPSLVVSDIRAALVEFLSSTFALSNDDVQDELASFLNHRSDGIFRGPYLRVRTPFKSVDPNWSSPLGWLPNDFLPYQHQATSFDRLSSDEGRTPLPTIVTTGTGSGKTECFLYPILDHCARERAKDAPGIKAVILYPMNALASDQAGRIAELVSEQPQLAGLRAGLYVGEGGSHTNMTAGALIDKRETLRNDPPDILLTNYKMLDFLLLRREDRNLWAANEPDTLQYIVLDEFHTYDGAQGSDVAMLLRRLGRTLRMNQPGRPLGAAAPVATSATLGSGPGAVTELCEFATKIFGVGFGLDAVVGETRQTVEEACEVLDYRLSIPDVEDLSKAGDDIAEIAAAFCRREQLDDEVPADVFDVTDVVELGNRLLQHPLTRAVLASVGERARSWPEALAEIYTRANNWGQAALRDPEPVERALGRYLWLLSLARRQQGDHLRPLFSVEVQLWVREVSRLLRTVSETPSFRWVDTAAQEDDTDHSALTTHELPAVYCRRCGQSGWRALQSELTGTLLTKVSTIYQESLKRGPTVRDLILVKADEPDARWYEPATRTITETAVEASVAVLITANEDDAKAQRCPSCGERDSMRFLGLQVASLASVAVNTLFGSHHIDDNERKLLAFTDSVQDASHRASFFAGRTHRFNLRTRMADIIKLRGNLALDELGDELFAKANTPRDLYDVIPPDLVRDPRVKTVWTDRVDRVGLDILRARLGFEADLEFGLRTRVGRTLERSRATSASVELSNFDEVVGLVTENLEHLVDGLSAETRAHVGLYVRGLLERLRISGGIVNPLLRPYLEDSGRLWHAWGGRPAGLPPFALGQGRPSFFTSANGGFFDSLSTVGLTPTWAIDWAVRSLGVAPTVAREVNLNTMALLTNRTDGVAEIAAGKSRVWGLNRHAIRIWDIVDEGDQATVAGVRCRLCGSRHPTPPHLVDDWVGTSCMRYRCVGLYEIDVPRSSNYYRRLYRSGTTRRVVTGEHTGMLNRANREALEQAFKSGTAPDSPNLITATPTLEMGIDIGDLSAVMLMSVPRNPASYVQRVGRAGRLNGNSLITTFVRSDTHGLYYLSDPEAMITGDVRPPNCYLDAVETLQRQYVAYLLDRMADLTIEAEPLPHQIGPLMKLGVDEGGMLRNLVDTSMLAASWVDDFLDLFGTHIDSSTIERLHEFAAAGIETAVKEAIEKWRAYERELSLRRTRLTAAIDRLAEQDHRTEDEDGDLASFMGQRAAVIELLRKHRYDYVLSALGDLGLLPNYLLHGDTATLRASLWSKNDAGEFSTETVEYTRSARLALREFAPGNTFYIGGHKHRIDTLEIGTADEPLYETWRLCPDCSYGEIEAEGETPKACPRCAGVAIADTGSRHTILRLRTAMANSSEENARVYDESDERDRERYEVITTIDADPAYITNAWALPDPAFGAELSGQTKLRTINLGFSERKGEQRFIGGVEHHMSRFGVCRYCGAVRDVRDDKQGTRPGKLHEGWCKVRSGNKNAKWDALLLLHELNTEAVRILLPVSMFEVDERLASFKGALLLGLREDFGGDPDHLEVAVTQLPNRGGTGLRRFLVLYDRVPGGTGYLARLADPDRMKDVLEKGRRVISQCQCRSEGRRACHRCLLGVVDRHEYDLVRRDLALELLDELLESWAPEPRATIADLDIGRVEESELERRFKVAVRAWAEHPDNGAVTFRTIPGKATRESFELMFVKGSEIIRYRIDEQEGLGTSPNTVPDFVFRRQDADGPDIGVYLDGFQFHASPENNNLADDAAKREGLRSSGKLAWSLTWQDVEDFHKATIGETLRKPPPRPLMPTNAQGVAQTVHLQKSGQFDFGAVNQNPVSLLLDYLSRPDFAQWQRLALSAVAGIASQSGLTHGLSVANLETVLRGAIGGEISWPAPEKQPAALAGQWVTVNDLPITLVLDAKDPDAERWTVIASIPSRTADVESAQHIPRWRDWLQWANLLQFLRSPGRDAVVAATETADSLDIDHLWLLDHVGIGTTQPESTSTADSPTEPVGEVLALRHDQEEELDLVMDDLVRQHVRAALEAGAKDFVAGYEIDGVPVEAVWPDRHVGIVPDGDRTDFDGYDIRTASEWTADELREAIKAAG